MQHFCRLTLGTIGIKTQTDQEPVLFRQTFQYLGQADLIRKFFLRGFHRDIYLPIIVLRTELGESVENITLAIQAAQPS